MEKQYSIIGSYNGLLCLYNEYERCVMLRNPSIMFESKKSPPVSLGWTIQHHGFGYDQVNNKYKVLLAMRKKNDHALTKIYIFGEDSWKTIPNFPTSRAPLRLSAKFVRSTFNWIVEKRDVISNQTVILSFDLGNETYKEILMPQEDGVKVYKHTLYVLNNCLGVCQVSNKTHWVAWLMKEYGVFDSCTKFVIISLDNFNKKSFFVIPLFISENGVILLMNSDSYQFVLYNLNSGKLDYLLEDTYNFMFNLHICCESLVSVTW
ncbi:F-box/kelch-repeat protein At3g23880-like [Vicia villosa]|uniref:F-box/kelch-repeat protein At3g23880-like n=1 Tax=Vicia villosa TaxID=3911 RepID=UPI00273CF4C7|nr:F-box/kelch-repeat protein At3g23880-like [Vicia villosa]